MNMRHTSQNAITEGDGILARNCEGTEQLRLYKINAKKRSAKCIV